MRKKIQKIKKFYYLYTSGLNRQEIEHLLNRDAVEAFSYLKSKTCLEDDVPRRTPVLSLVFVLKEIFISFLMQLSAARRLLYGIGVAGFLWGLVVVDKFLLFAGFFVINFLLVLELVDKLTTRDELEIAREIQLGLQPERIPENGMLSIAAFSQPAKLVGGDFFDVVQCGDEWIISIIGDVSGKGISAALYAAYIQSMFISLTATNITPCELLTRLNDLISARLRDGHFITVAVAMFNTVDKSVTVARAGHNWPLYYSSKTKAIQELKPRGFSIGFTQNGLFSSSLEEQKIQLDSGDLLLLYSDGITEATNSQDTMFKTTGLMSVMEESAHQSSETIIGRIKTRLFEFVEATELQDDATMIAIKIK